MPRHNSFGYKDLDVLMVTGATRTTPSAALEIILLPWLLRLEQMLCSMSDGTMLDIRQSGTSSSRYNA